MGTKSWIVAAGFLLAGSLAWVRHEEAHDPYSSASLEMLFSQRLDPRPDDPSAERALFWHALLEEPFAQRTPAGLRLRLGRVLAHPGAARGSAEHAGELLALEAAGPEGLLGLPLWGAILERAARESDTENGRERVLKLYGCRHNADPDAGPLIEDTYAARLSLAEALGRHGASEVGALPLSILGQDAPLKGGVNFDVLLLGDTQSIEVTFDGEDGPPLTASRLYRPSSPHDASARSHVVAVLRALVAGEPERGSLTIEGQYEALPAGVELSLEIYDGTLAVTARSGTKRLSTNLRRGGQGDEDSISGSQ